MYNMRSINPDRTINLKKILYFVIVFMAIFCSHDTLLFGTSTINAFIQLRRVLPFILTALLLLITPINIRTKALLALIVMVGLIFLSCLYNHEDVSNYVYRAFLMIAAFLLVQHDKREDFTIAFNRILTFLSIWSIAFFVIVNFIPGAASIFPTLQNIGRGDFITSGFATFSRNYLYGGICRNAGIFREPGVHMTMLTLAILFELNLGEKKSIKRLLLFMATMITTLSTAAFIIFVIILAYIILSQKALKTKHKILLLVLVIVMFWLVDQVADLSGHLKKFEEGTNAYGSWFARLQSVWGNVRIAFENPLFGIGRYTLYETVLASDMGYTAVDNTNTFLINFSAFGILYGSLCLIGAYLFFKKATKSFLVALFCFGVLLVSFSNEDMGQNIAYFYVVFKGFLEWNGSSFRKGVKNANSFN